MVLPVEVNGVSLNFIVDTGVNYPILFNLSQSDSLRFFDYEEIEIRGLGEGDAVKAIRSRNNAFRVGSLINTSQELYILMDREINFSSRLGVEVHGVIGYDLFKSFVVEINYRRGKMRFNRPESYQYRRCASCDETELHIIRNKPFLSGSIVQNEKEVPVFLLMDTGSTDALWLLEDEETGIAVPKAYFNDFMGRGLSGNIYGKRARLEAFSFAGFTLKDAKVAFPDSSSVKHVTDWGQRNGSVGGEVMKRFHMVVDYPNERLRMKKNAFFKEPFKYNMSGMELQHNGLRLVREIAGRFTNGIQMKKGLNGGVEFVLDRPTYQIELHPSFEIASLREGSPAAEAGLKEGDVILSINGKPAHHYKLQELNEMINEKAGKQLRLLIDRQGRELQFAFELKKVL